MVKSFIPLFFFIFVSFITLGCQTQNNREKTSISKNDIETSSYTTNDVAILGNASIRFYQLFISSQDEPSCIFTPTCSHYATQALRQRGIVGIFLAIDRISRCNPVNAQNSTLYLRTPDGKLIDPVDTP